MTLQPLPFELPYIYEENLIFLFIGVHFVGKLFNFDIFLSYFQNQGGGGRDFFTSEEGSGVEQRKRRRGCGWDNDRLRRSGLIIEKFSIYYTREEEGEREEMRKWRKGKEVRSEGVRGRN